MSSRWWSGDLDRRATPRAEYRRTAPALLEYNGLRCAVRDLGTGGLRIEPAPAGRVWTMELEITGEIHLRGSGRMLIVGRIARIDRAGLAVLPVGSLWPSEEAVEAERSLLMSSRRERRSAPRLPIPLALGAMTPLRDISATGLRYVVGPNERPPELGGSVEGAVQLDAETVIEVRGRVVRRMGREVAVALDPPGLEPEVMTILRRRFFPEGAARTS